MEQASTVTVKEPRSHKIGAPQVLEFEKSLTNAQRDFATEISAGKFTESDLEAYIKEHVETIRIGNVDVTVIDKEHKGAEGILDPVLEAYIRNRRTAGVMLEYFNPEILQNARATPLMGNFLASRYEKYSKKSLVGHLSDEIAEVCKETQKPIAVADIANKITFEVHKFVVPTVGLSVLLSIPPEIRQQLFISVPGFAATTMVLLNYSTDALAQAGILHKGIFSKDKVRNYERFLFDTEDARRLFTAEGAKRLAEEQQTKETEIENPQVVVVEPKAHALRVKDYLKEHSGLTKALIDFKRNVYRRMPNLDFKVRIWNWQNSNNEGHWTKTAELPY